MPNCGHCHTCGKPVIIVLDGEEWCPHCCRYQRPLAHGWAEGTADESPCPQPKEA